VNRLLIVGISLNIANDSTAAVTSVTYNGTALSLVGAHNDASNTRRSELWSLLAPATGVNKNIVVSVTVPGALTVGAVAGAVSSQASIKPGPWIFRLLRWRGRRLL